MKIFKGELLGDEGLLQDIPVFPGAPLEGRTFSVNEFKGEKAHMYPTIYQIVLTLPGRVGQARVVKLLGKEAQDFLGEQSKRE